MEHIKKSLTHKGFSERAAQAVLDAHRKSTQVLYDKKWQVFASFCNSQGWATEDVRVPMVGDFLVHLRDAKKLKGSTIGTYLTAVSSVLRRTIDISPAQSPELQAMVRSFRLEDQRKVFKPPQWDLNIILKYLSSGACEPLDDVPLETLTIKTVFLVGMATAARVSEIHAIDSTRVSFDDGATGVAHLGLALDFVAKNQGLNEEARVFHVAPLRSHQDAPHPGEASLCPVRALRCYLRRTQASRGQRKRLFLPLGNKPGEITKNSISYWLKAAILRAYDAAGLPAPTWARPHELRAVAASMALHSNISVQNIVQGCFWAGDSTFAAHYLRDMSVEDVEGLKSFGPLVLAQQIVNPPTRRR